MAKSLTGRHSHISAALDDNPARSSKSCGDFMDPAILARALQARGTTLLVGATGFHLTHAWSLWDRFTNPGYWWMHAMVVVWAIFTVMLFVSEPLFLHRWFRERARRARGRSPRGTGLVDLAGPGDRFTAMVMTAEQDRTASVSQFTP
jgi:hypothetical protein